MFAHPAVGEVLWGMRMSTGECHGCHPGLSEDFVGLRGNREQVRLHGTTGSCSSRPKKKFRESLPPLHCFGRFLPVLCRCGVALQSTRSPTVREPLVPMPEILVPRLT